MNSIKSITRYAISLRLNKKGHSLIYVPMKQKWADWNNIIIYSFLLLQLRLKHTRIICQILRGDHFFTVGNIAMTLMCHLNWCHSSNTWSVIHNCPNALKMAEKLMNFLQDPLSGNWNSWLDTKFWALSKVPRCMKLHISATNFNGRIKKHNLQFLPKHPVASAQQSIVNIVSQVFTCNYEKSWSIQHTPKWKSELENLCGVHLKNDDTVTTAGTNAATYSIQ